MTDETDTPLPNPTPLATGGIIHPPAAIQAAAARLRRFLELWDSTEDVIGFNEEFRLGPDDLTVVLDALDACTVPTGIIEFPKPLTEQQYEDLKAKWRETHMASRHDVKIEWVEPPADSDTLLKQMRRWVRTRPSGGGA